MANVETLQGNPEESPTPYESIELELGEGDIETAMELYLDFVQLPAEEREKIVHLDPDRPRTGRSGYKHKGIFAADGSPLQDNKHLFHMTPALAEEFCDPWNNRLQNRNLPFETRNFLDVAQEIYHSIAASTKEKYQTLESEFPMLVGLHFPRGGKTAHHLRFLAYQAGSDGMLARGHYDKGTGTIAVAESHGGLRLGYGEDDLQLLDRDHFDPVFFHGYGWHQLAEILDVDTNKKAAWHDVVQLDEQVNDEVMRWAMVHFVGPANMYLDSTEAQTHSPIDWRNGQHGIARTLTNQSFLTE